MSNHRTEISIGQRRIDRAVHERRGGYPVAVMAGDRALLMVSAEHFLDTLQLQDSLFPLASARLAVSGIRARRMGLKTQTDITLPFALFAEAPALFSQVIDPAFAAPSLRPLLAGAVEEGWERHMQPATELDIVTLQLAKFAGLLPAVVLAPLDGENIGHWLQKNHILSVSAEDIEQHQDILVSTLRPISSASVPLKLAENAKVLAFRPRYGAVEHLAVVIGDPAQVDSPLVRLHSSCITGDILGSLRCDCGEQLHSALARISEAGAGVLLYMNQEGRGIGIANKLRAYQLQDAGLDTLDANEEIGFAGDERRFELAAAMLRQLGILRVKLLSNNPDKRSALESAGILVVEREGLVVAPNVHNASYLRTKTERLGHQN